MSSFPRPRSRAGSKYCQAVLFVVLTITALMLTPKIAVAQQNDLGGGFGSHFSVNGLGGLGKSGLNDSQPSKWSAKYFVVKDASARDASARDASARESGIAKGVLEVQAILAPRWHVYSVTQPDGGPRKTKISIKGPDNVSIEGDFSPDYQPAKSESTVYKDVTIEEHSDEVLWTATISLPADFQSDLSLDISALVCKSGDGRCLPVDETVVAKFAGTQPGNETGDDETPQNQLAESDEAALKVLTQVSEKASAGPITPEFRDDGYVVGWTAQMIPATVGLGDQTIIEFTATPDPKFHVYQAMTDDSEASTNFVITEKSDLKIGKPTTKNPVISQVISPTMPPVKYHGGKVSWSLPIDVPVGTPPGMKRIEGMIAYQACTDNSCHQPKALKFTALVNVGDAAGPDKAGAIELVSAKYAAAMDSAGETDWVDKDVKLIEISTIDALQGGSRSIASGAMSPRIGMPTSPLAALPINRAETSDSGAPSVDPNLAGVGEAVSDHQAETASTTLDTDPVLASTGTTSFPVVLLLALFGGLVLNFMPCVLPVIGLKVMSFVGQGGEDRKRVLALNFAYVAGICAVFAMLATLAIFFSFGWGQQFQYFSVRLGVTVGLFAFALSYFNVWEIPVPGMAAGKKSQDLQNKEGYAGAFSKGIFTTLLATPCSGPLLGGVFGATIGMPPVQTVMVFAMLALGMSSPYLLLGFKPELARFLPKPGPWMETFKQLMAFLFLAAVAYFFYQFADENKFPVFVTLMGVWFGCWIIGLVPSWAAIQKRLLAWGSGIAVATAVGIMAFTVLKSPPILQWVDYDEQALEQYQAQGKTVLVDFSAKWCPNCLVNLEVAIDTEKTRRIVDQNDVIAMYADWTNDNPEIKSKLEELNSNSIPVLAIYPAGRPNQPIILRDLVSQASVLDALKKAGPSHPRRTARSANSETLVSK